MSLEQEWIANLQSTFFTCHSCVHILNVSRQSAFGWKTPIFTPFFFTPKRCDIQMFSFDVHQQCGPFSELHSTCGTNHMDIRVIGLEMVLQSSFLPKHFGTLITLNDFDVFEPIGY